MKNVDILVKELYLKDMTNILNRLRKDGFIVKRIFSDGVVFGKCHKTEICKLKKYVEIEITKVDDIVSILNH